MSIWNPRGDISPAYVFSEFEDDPCLITNFTMRKKFKERIYNNLFKQGRFGVPGEDVANEKL